MKKDLKKIAEKKASKEESEREIKEHFNNPKLGKNKHSIVIGDSRHMKSVADNSVHLVITSPPYFNAKDYSYWPTLEDYLKDMRGTI
ncbi:MAG: hypothetical protein WC596_04920, partial [Candidatus Shapirobacteria bacterium]